MPCFSPQRCVGPARWCVSAIPALGSCGSEDGKFRVGLKYREFEVNLGYMKPYLRNRVGETVQ